MTDISIGRALWNDLVRQIAVRDYYDTADLRHTARVKLAHYRSQAPADELAAFAARNAINASIEHRRNWRSLKNLGIAHSPYRDEGGSGHAAAPANYSFAFMQRVKRESVDSETK
jgi:hypothetical protein